MITGPSTTWCFVSDMNKAVAFYKEFLGITPRVVTPYWSDFTVGGLSIGLHPGKPVEGGGNWTLGLETNDLKGLKSKAATVDVKVWDEYHQTPAGVVLTFCDPDGNHIQVIQPGSTIAEMSD